MVWNIVRNGSDNVIFQNLANLFYKEIIDFFIFYVLKMNTDVYIYFWNKHRIRNNWANTDLQKKYPGINIKYLQRNDQKCVFNSKTVILKMVSNIQSKNDPYLTKKYRRLRFHGTGRVFCGRKVVHFAVSAHSSNFWYSGFLEYYYLQKYFLKTVFDSEILVKTFQ